MIEHVRRVLSPALIEYAREESVFLTPPVRSAGFGDVDERGSGDFLDHVGTLASFLFFAENGCWVKREVVAGPGDSFDLSLLLLGGWYSMNVKTSRYAPFRDDLHLMVKEEELWKETALYMQVFVHLEEPNDPEPHAHLCGYIRQEVLKETPVSVLPQTGGHRGIQIKLTDLRPLSKLIQASARW